MEGKKIFKIFAVIGALIVVPASLFAADNIDDVIVYRGGADTSIPVYKTHDDGGFGTASTAQDISSAIQFVKVLAKPGYTSTEKLLCTKDSANDVSCQIYNGSAWGNLLEVSQNAGGQKGYDIAYEQVSGRAMVCFRTTTVDNQTPGCRLWNGTSWGSEFSANAVGAAINTMRLVSDPGSDYIAMLTKDSGDDLNVQVWNGTSWGSVQELSTGTGACSTCLPYDASWEKTNGDLVAVWFDDASDALYSREYDKSTLWATEITNIITGLSVSDSVYVETDSSSEPASDGVLAAVIDDDNTLTANYWSGSGWGTAQELSANINGSVSADTHLFDLAYEQKTDYDAVLVYGSTANSLKYRVWDTGTLAWGSELSLPTATQDKDWLQLAADPNRQNIMLTTVGTTTNVDSIEWTGSVWDSGWTSHDTGSNDINWNAWFAYDYEDEDNTPSVVSFNSAAQKTDGTGLVDISIDVTDEGLHKDKLKIEYETDGDGACDGPWTNATLSGPATASYEDTGGPPDINNSVSYQVGSGTNTQIVTASGTNTITFDWASATDLPTGNATYCLRATGNDGIVDSLTPDTVTLTIDNVAPTGLTALTNAEASDTIQHMNWTAVTETNFDHYEIWYGENLSDVQNRTGTAAEWDQTDYLAMGIITNHHTHITGLTASTLYYYKIWAVDTYGNEETVAALSHSTSAVGNSDPIASTPTSISQAGDGSGYVTFSTTIYDDDIEPVQMRVRFSPDGGTTFYNAHINSAVVTPGDLVPDDPFSIDNDNDFQIAHSDPISLNASSRHPVRLTVVWDTKSALNQNGGLNGQALDVIIRVSPRDASGAIGLDYDSAPFALDNAAATLAESVPVPAGTTDLTPDYTFTSTAAGTISYGGSCSGSDTTASVGSNLITFDLAPGVEGTYSDCTIMVTDALSNDSNTLSVSAFTIDATSPSGLTSLVIGANTQKAQTLSWTAVTETNFDHYEIWYGTNQSDVQNRIGTAAEWDGDDDANLPVRTTTGTTITGLSPSTTYYYKIWAVDIAAQEETVSDVNAATDANNKPTGTISSIIQATDGSKDIEVFVVLNDADDDILRAKLEYETDFGGACNGPWAAATLSGPVTASYDDSSGPPDVNDLATYQLGSGSGTGIVTSSGANTVQFEWDALNDLPTADSQIACLRLTSNDAIDDQLVPTTLSATIDVDDPEVSAVYIEHSILFDANSNNIADIDDTVLVTWDNSASGDNNTDLASAWVNMENYGASDTIPLFDDGTHGDATGGDQIYSYLLTIVSSTFVTSSAHPHVTAIDSFGNETTTAASSFIIVDARPPAPQVGGSGGSAGGSNNPIPSLTPEDTTVNGGYDPAAALSNNPTISIDKDLPKTSDTKCGAGDLIKGSLSSVYYCGTDGKRYVFANEGVYFSWYADFSKVMTVNDETLAALQIGGNVTYRPGFRMVKIQSDPRVYAVARGGILRWIPTEEKAALLYGENWNKLIEDIPDSFFVNYKFGSPL